MSKEEENNMALIRELVEEIFNKHQPDKADVYYDPGYIQHDPGVAPGREGFKSSFRAIFEAFPDWHCELGPMFAKDDTVISFQTHKATHKKEFRGIPATGKKITIEAAHRLRIENGRVAEHWHVVQPEGFKWVDFLLR